MLSIPDFVNSRISVSRDAEHADFAIRLEVGTDDDGNRLDFLTASSVNTNLSDRISFKWPNADYEEVIAEKAVKLLFAHCAARRDDTRQESQLPPEVVKQKLSAARIMKPVVHTSSMREKVFLAALKARPEFVDWGIEISRGNERADFDLVVGRMLSTLTWTFKLVDHDSGSLLDSGTVIAFNDDRAASRIAAATVKQIAARRPLSLHHPNPTVAVPSRTSHKVVYQWASETDVYQGPLDLETWVIKAVSEDMIKRFPERMRLFIQDGNLVASDLKGRMLFSIPGDSILDFADTKSYDSLGDNIRGDDDNWNGCGEGCAFGLLLYIPALVVLDRFRMNQHIFEIAWTENETIHVASLQMTKGDYYNLMSTLKSLMPQ